MNADTSSLSASTPLCIPLIVAVVTETYPPEVNGVASTIARFVKGLHAKGHHIQLYRPRQSRVDQAQKYTRYKEKLVQGMAIPGYKNLKMGLPAKHALVRAWTWRRPDVVHIVTEGPLGWSALRAAKELRIPVCSDFRTNFHAYSSHYGLGWFNKSIQKYLRHFHNGTDMTMVPTQAMLAQLQERGYHNLQVVARGVDTHLFHPEKRHQELRRHWGVSHDTPVALHVGRLAPEKNLDVVVQAYRAMQQRHPGVKLVWVGDGPDRHALQATCPDAIFAGMQSGESLAQHYASADVFLFASLSETFGNVTLEAMASGLATVAFDYAAAAQVIQHQENGLLASCDDQDAFIAQAAALATAHKRIRWLGGNARLTSLTLSWDTVVAQLEAHHQSLVKEPLLLLPNKGRHPSGMYAQLA